MRKFTYPIAIAIIVIAALQLQAKDHAAREQASVLIEQELDPFNQLVLAGVFNTIIQSGDKEAMVIDAEENLLEYIEIENKNGRLTIKTDEAFKKQKNENIKVYITCKDLSLLKISGVGSVKTENTLKCEDLDLDINGVGQIQLNVATEQIMCKISAVGNVELTGKAKKATMNISGIGNFDASMFKVNNLYVNNSGVGQVQVHAIDDIELKSSGIGSVTYFGNPKHKNISNSGLGKVKER